ncbi:MAG: hypothetical protein ABJO67_06385 [Pseudoruegeria sp.]
MYFITSQMAQSAKPANDTTPEARLRAEDEFMHLHGGKGACCTFRVVEALAELFGKWLDWTQGIDCEKEPAQTEKKRPLETKSRSIDLTSKRVG